MSVTTVSDNPNYKSTSRNGRPEDDGDERFAIGENVGTDLCQCMRQGDRGECRAGTENTRTEMCQRFWKGNGGDLCTTAETVVRDDPH